MKIIIDKVLEFEKLPKTCHECPFVQDIYYHDDSYIERFCIFRKGENGLFYSGGVDFTLKYSKENLANMYHEVDIMKFGDCPLKEVGE